MDISYKEITKRIESEITKRIESELKLAKIALTWTEEFKCSEFDHINAERNVKHLERVLKSLKELSKLI